MLDVKRTIAVGDEVNFTVANDPNNVQKQLAIRIKHLEPGTVKFDLVIAKDVTGTVDKVIEHRLSQRGTQCRNVEHQGSVDKVSLTPGTRRQRRVGQQE